MSAEEKPLNFLQSLIKSDIEKGSCESPITRFPPEPNGYLHIGHAKSICLNFGLAQEFGGGCHLRFDDTNPVKEDDEFVKAIEKDVAWLGYSWRGPVRFASDYFQQFYEWAHHLIDLGIAYVCELSPDQARQYRGTLTEAGTDSPYRERSVEENRALFTKMRAGELDEGSMVLRAKIDMAHPNINMRDPILYRIRKQPHHRTGDEWPIYPSYDFAHGQEDAIEGVTHSICTLEFQDHRPLYDWFLQNLPVPSQPRQYEFARLNLTYTVTSKRKLKALVDEGVVDGWDDPRMPTISGMRRRGYPPEAIRAFCDMIGVTRSDSLVDVSMLEFAVRDHLNEHAPRAMCVLRPLKLSILNYRELVGSDDLELDVPVHPNRPEMGQRTLGFGPVIWIDKDDFSEDTTLSRKKFKRLVIQDYVRLRGSFVIKAEQVIRNEDNDIIEVQVNLVESTLGQNPPEGIKPRGVIHWVSDRQKIDCRVRLYDRLFNHSSPDSGDQDYMQKLNPDSLIELPQCYAEQGLGQLNPGETVQFEREGYFTLDQDSSGGELIFNRTIGLKDNWANKL